MILGGRAIGGGHPCFVIAEAGVNHNGSRQLALALVDAAAAAGADAVKFQTFRADALATPAAPKAEYQRRTTDGDESQLAMLRRLELTVEDHLALMTRCSERGIEFLSSPFDEASGDLLERLGVPAFKVPSGELTNLSLLRHLAAKRRPLIVSTGMATLDDVQAAMMTMRAAGAEAITLLHCVSAYPAMAADANLRAMATMAEAFGVPVGYSDHVAGCEVALAAVALGACVLEKHLTLDCAMSGPDHQASLEPSDFAALVASIRTVERALGSGEKQPAEAEFEVARAARRSLVAAQTITRGAALEAAMVAVRRPGTGLAPARLGELLGRQAVADIAAGTLLTPEMFA